MVNKWHNVTPPEEQRIPIKSIKCCYDYCVDRVSRLSECDWIVRVCVCVLLWLYVILKQALDFSTCHSALLSKANKISHEYAVITNANCHHSPPTRCACGCVSVYTYVFAPRAIDIGSVNPILSTSLQQQGIIHKNNLNIYVTWHAKKGHKSSLRLSSHDGVHI